MTDRQGVVVEHPTFHDAARARGLISGHDEYFICMEEAAVFRMPHQLRRLLVTLIQDGGRAPRLWADYQDSLIEDFLFRPDRVPVIDEALGIIDLKLQLHGKNKQVNLPEASHPQTEYQRMLTAFKSDGETLYADTNEPVHTTEQLT